MEELLHQLIESLSNYLQRFKNIRPVVGNGISFLTINSMKLQGKFDPKRLVSKDVIRNGRIAWKETPCFKHFLKHFLNQERSTHVYTVIMQQQAGCRNSVSRHGIAPFPEVGHILFWHFVAPPTRCCSRVGISCKCGECFWNSGPAVSELGLCFFFQRTPPWRGCAMQCECQGLITSMLWMDFCWCQVMYTNCIIKQL